MAEDVTRMTQAAVLDRLGGELVFWIDPAKIAFSSGTARLPVTRYRTAWLDFLPKRLTRPLKRRLAPHEPYVIPARCFGPLEPIEATAKHRRIADLVANRATPLASQWRAEMVARFQRKGRAGYKKTKFRAIEEIDDFIQNYALAMIEGLAASGYDMAKGAEIGTAQVDAEGRLVKSGSGTHRFLAARVLGLTAFPLRISGIHADWARKITPPGGVLTPQTLAEHLRGVVAPYR